MLKFELILMKEQGGFLQLQFKSPKALTVAQLLELSHLKSTYPDIFERPMGIFSKKVELSTGLKSGDRLEIYLPLLIDPKEKRRQKAKRKSSLVQSASGDRSGNKG